MSQTEREAILEAAAAYKKHQAYMQAYNQRAEVKEKRKLYNSKRWQLMKRATELLREEKI
jgi:hypothetical protein